MSSDTHAERQLGPIDFLVIEFPPGAMTGEGMPLLVDLVDRRIISVLDLVFLRKSLDGTVSRLDIGELDREGARGLAVFAGASSGLLGRDDVDEVGVALEPGSAAAVLVYENLWAAPLATALVRGGGRLVASGRIGVPELLAALDALDAEAPGADPAGAATGGRRGSMATGATAGGSRATKE